MTAVRVRDLPERPFRYRVTGSFRDQKSLQCRISIGRPDEPDKSRIELDAVLDTGATSCIIPHEIVERLGLRSIANNIPLKTTSRIEKKKAYVIGYDFLDKEPMHDTWSDKAQRWRQINSDVATFAKHTGELCRLDDRYDVVTVALGGNRQGKGGEAMIGLRNLALGELLVNRNETFSFCF